MTTLISHPGSISGSLFASPTAQAPNPPFHHHTHTVFSHASAAPFAPSRSLSTNSATLSSSPSSNPTSHSSVSSSAFSSLLPLHLRLPSDLSAQSLFARFHSSLTSRHPDIRAKSSAELRTIIEQQLLSLPPRDSLSLLSDVTSAVLAMVGSQNVWEQLGGLCVMDDMCDCRVDSHELIIIRFATAFRLLFNRTASTTQPVDNIVLEKAAKVLGHLARVGLTVGGGGSVSGGGGSGSVVSGSSTQQSEASKGLSTASLTLTEELVEFQVGQALERLAQSTQPQRLLCAVLVLSQLALNTPTLFNPHISAFLDHIWAAVWSGRVEVRQAAVQALRVCLLDISKRSQRWRVQCYSQLYNTAMHPFTNRKAQSNASHIHGSLLVLGELLNTAPADLIAAHFNIVADLLLRYRSSSQPTVVRTVIQLLPRLAAVDRRSFVDEYMSECVSWLLSECEESRNGDVAFVSIGQLVMSAGVEMNDDEIEAIVQRVSTALVPPSQPSSSSTFSFLSAKPKARNHRSLAAPPLACTAMLACALSSRLTPYLSPLLDLMFAGGLTPALIDALMDVMSNVPEVTDSVQRRLLDCIASILSRQPAAHPPLLILALKTLSSFAFNGADVLLLALLRDVVMPYVAVDSPLIRREAALTIARTLCRLGSHIRGGRQGELLYSLLKRLVVVAIADPIPVIRLTVLSSLDERLDHVLAQSDVLYSVFVALNDEIFTIRELCIELLGRLSSRNPAVIMPVLRKQLIQLLASLQQMHSDTLEQEESSKLLSHLITASHHLIRPYVSPILHVLVPRITEMSYDTRASGVGSYVLSTLGELSVLCGDELLHYMDDLMPLIIATLQDRTSHIRRQVALHTLAQLLSSTGLSSPTLKYPQLMSTVLQQLKVERQSSVRLEVLKVLGIIGALDPLKYRMAHTLTEGSETDERRRKSTHVPMLTHSAVSTAVNGATNTAAAASTHAPMPSPSPPPLSYNKPVDPAASLAQSAKFDLTDSTGVQPHEEYYPTIAIASLLRILLDGRLSQHHHMCVRAMLFIYQTMGVKCVGFLPYVLPAVLAQVRAADSGGGREVYVQHLVGIVSIVRSHIKPYVEDVMALASEYWGDSALIPTLLSLIEHMALSLRHEFQPQLAVLVPKLVSLLQDSAQSSTVVRVLHALQIMCTKGSYSASLHVLLPCLVRLCEQYELPESTRIECVECLAVLTASHSIVDHASRLIHPFARMLVSSGRDMSEAIMKVMCEAVQQLGYGFLFFEPMVSALVKGMDGREVSQYRQLVARLMAEVKEVREKRGIIGDNAETPIVLSYAAMEAFKPDDPLLSPAPSPPHQPAANDEKAAADLPPAIKRLHTNQPNLQRAWTAANRATKDDWNSWMRQFSIELLKESPSSALRACSSLATKYPPLARELFFSAFLSVWVELFESYQSDLIHHLTLAFHSRFIPTDITTVLLSLAEYMEHHDRPLPIDIRTLGDLAERSHAFAKALHYQEEDAVRSGFASDSHRIGVGERGGEAVEALIGINVKLQQADAAHGVLKVAERQGSGVEVRESWYEKLQRWDEALEAYERKEAERTRRAESDGEEDSRQNGRPKDRERQSNKVRNDWRRPEKPMREESKYAHEEEERESSDVRDYIEDTLLPDDEEKGESDEYEEEHKQPLLSASFSYASPVSTSRTSSAFLRSSSATITTITPISSTRSVQPAPPASLSPTSPLSSAWIDTTLGRLRCLRALGEHDRLFSLTSSLWSQTTDPSVHRALAPLACSACCGLRQWSALPLFLPSLEEGRASTDSLFYHAIHAVWQGDGERAQLYIDRCSESVDGSLTALVGESYTRAYRSIVRLQQLSELSEVLSYQQAAATGGMDRCSAIRRMWLQRLDNCQRDVDVWQEVLMIRSLVVPPHEDVHTYLEFSSLCRKQGKLHLSEKTITSLLGVSPLLFVSDEQRRLPSEQPHVTLAAVQHLHAVGYQQKAWNRLNELIHSSSLSAATAVPSLTSPTGSSTSSSAVSSAMSVELCKLKSRCYLKLGQWQMDMFDSYWDGIAETEDNRSERAAAYQSLIPQVLSSFQSATQLDDTSRAWHEWSMMNYRVVTHTTHSHSAVTDVSDHVVPAIHGFFRAIYLQSATDGSPQDVLRVLQLWFEWGARKEVEQAVLAGMNTISIDTWLAVIPQLIARIHTSSSCIRNLLTELLCRIGKGHPQALVYPLTVASKSPSEARKAASLHVLHSMRQHSSTLVSQAGMVSSELVRVAILWHELWHEAIDEAGRHWFGVKNADGMYAALHPLHQAMERGPQTARELNFHQLYGRELQEAFDWLKKYMRGGDRGSAQSAAGNSTSSRREKDMTRAWELYTAVFNKVRKQIGTMNELELGEVSPKLLQARDMQLAVPGSYRVGLPVIRIAYFSPLLRVIESKQHPRRLTIGGSDGNEYLFLLKGHEDLRQDERVMQLFGLVNTLLSGDRTTAKYDLDIRRYEVIPLSPASGLIEWVPHWLVALAFL